MSKAEITKEVEASTMRVHIGEENKTFYQKLEDTPSIHFYLMVEHYASGALEYIQSCESPIEQIMGLEFYRMQHIFGSIFGGDLLIESQEKEGNYRLDFIFVGMRDGVTKKMAVECDGHDFHEKTKEQAKRDKSRDRELLRMGIPVIRFTGSEIVDNVQECASEAFQTFLSLFGGK